MPKISALPGAAALTGAELVPIVQTGATVKTTVGDIQAGAGGYPHWITPGAGFLEWKANGAPVATEFRIHDDGHSTAHWQPALDWRYQDVAGVDCVIFVFGGGTWQHLVGNGYQIVFSVLGGGQWVIDHATNKLTEAGFAATSRQYIAAAPGNWGGPGVPADLETATDRIAAAVAGLLGGPIP